MESLFSIFVAYIQEVTMGVVMLGIFGLIIYSIFQGGLNGGMDKRD